MQMDKNIQWLQDLADLLREEKHKLKAHIAAEEGRIIIIDDFIAKLEANIKDLQK